MKKIKLNQISVYRFDNLEKYADINHFITTRQAGAKMEFNICIWAVEDMVSVISNRKLLASELGIHLSDFVFQQQKHTRNVSAVISSDGGKGSVDYETGLEANDSMITSEKGICLMVICGDCVPLLFFDPVKKVIGAAHSGWRGTAKRIAEHTIENMHENYGCNPKDILVGIGPSIGPESYEVDDVVLKEFSKTFKNTKEFFQPKTEHGKYMLDLWKANVNQLIEAGVQSKNIEVSGISTFTNNKDFFSARRGDTGRFGCGIMLI